MSSGRCFSAPRSLTRTFCTIRSSVVASGAAAQVLRREGVVADDLFGDPIAEAKPVRCHQSMRQPRDALRRRRAPSASDGSRVSSPARKPGRSTVDMSMTTARSRTLSLTGFVVSSMLMVPVM